MLAAPDVLVLGGGPAGCAAALALRQRGVGVTVVEAGTYHRPRIGESLPPDAGLLLRALGVWDAFVDAAHAPCRGSCASWGSDALGYNDFVFNPHGTGWHLDRTRFDALLADRAAAAGARVLRATVYRRATPQPGGGYTVTLDGPGGPAEIAARIVVDATGRRGLFARERGATRLMLDRLVAVAGFVAPEGSSKNDSAIRPLLHAPRAASILARCLDVPPGAPSVRPAGARALGTHISAPGRSNRSSPSPGARADTTLTLLEATAYGYWYAAALPDGRRVVVVASDADLARQHGLTRPTGWAGALRATRHVSARFAGCTLPAEVHPWAAPTFRLDRPASLGWLAIGDAAAAYDPISAQGIYKALDDGIAAADAIERMLAGDPGAVDAWRNRIRAAFGDYVGNRNYFYAMERRWPDAPFWGRRRARTGGGGGGSAQVSDSFFQPTHLA